VSRPHPPTWPYVGVDSRSLRASGWQPTPFREFVLKVHQRCNLACDYCYVYELADQSWRDRPIGMSAEVWRATSARIGEHVRAHGLSRISVVLHGGEPLLAGREGLLRLIADVRAAVPAECSVRFGLQTNGVLLKEPMIEVLRDAGVRIGVSIDGSAADHDRHRRRRDGTGSHRAVDRALRLLGSERHRAAYAGLLCTVDPANDPIACYESLLDYAPPAIDFLLPHANWSTPPLRSAPTPHGDWLVQIFDRWYSAPRQETRIRLFEEAIHAALGGASRTEQIGLSPVAVAVVESDGAIEQVDSLKSAYDGACATGLSVHTDTFDAALEHPGIIARQLGSEALGESCRACSVHQICGAGHYAHRYDARNGFRNPSVYCADLKRLILHLQRRLSADLFRLRATNAA